MSNEIIKQLPITEIMTIGKAFTESGMFPDIRSAAQAVVKIQAGQEMGISPFAAMNGINIILGKPTVGAGIIASKVKSSGKYDYKVVEHSDTVCSIDYYQGKEKIGNSTFTIQDAKRANTKNLDKFPKNMLFARAMSNGQKWYCPDVFNGPVYTPEEMESVTEDVPHVVLRTTDSKIPEPAPVAPPAVTSYNHNTMGTTQKPLISNLQFKQLCERVRNGDAKAYYSALAVFTFETTQKITLEELFAALPGKDTEIKNSKQMIAEMSNQ